MLSSLRWCAARRHRGTTVTTKLEARPPHCTDDEQHMHSSGLFDCAAAAASRRCAARSCSPGGTAALGQVTRSTEPVEIAPAALPRRAADTVLAEGERLESLRRWGEAPDPLRRSPARLPGQRSARRREDLAKLHFSLDRRYADRSYLRFAAIAHAAAGGGAVPGAAAKDQHALRDHAAVAAAGGPRRRRRSIWRCWTRRFAGPTAATCRPSSSRRRAATVSARGPADWWPAPTICRPWRPRRPGWSKRAAACGRRPALLEFVAAAAGGLDEYSAYLTSRPARDVYQQIEGNFVGLGVELKADDGALLIVHVIPGSPAERAGIRRRRPHHRGRRPDDRRAVDRRSGGALARARRAARFA